MVLGRLRSERIAADLKSGKITEEQAESLMETVRSIHQQEMRDVVKNDGSLTKSEQEKLNREEDMLAKHIHHDVAKNAEKREERAEKGEKSDHGKSSKK